MQVRYADLSDEQIKLADAIFAMDPNDGLGRQVYGSSEIARIRPFPAKAYTIQVLDVQLDGRDDARFQELRRRVVAIKNAQKDESARELAKKHYQVEPGLSRIIRFSGSADVAMKAAEPIKFLEVNENSVPSGVMALGFDAVPASGIRFPSIIIEVTPREFEKIQTKELRLPRGWEFEEDELAKPLDGCGQE